MALGYAVGEIAGVVLENAAGSPCKVLLLDVGNFKPTFTGNTVHAADGTPHTQILAVTAGRAFGVRVEYIPPDVLNNIVDAINLAVANGDSFSIDLADDLTTINENCIPDFQAGWLKIEPQRTHPDVIKNAELRFLTVE
jgi:hypothetical protein